MRPSYTPQLVMEGIIDDFDQLRPTLGEARAETPTRCRSRRSACARRCRGPDKILCLLANYWEHAQREPRPLNMFMKNPDAVIGPGDTILLPDFTVPWIFMHEAELALVMKGPAKMVKPRTGAVPCSATPLDRRLGARAGAAHLAGEPPTSWLGKSFDTFAPIGPCIVTADEIDDPNDLHRAASGTTASCATTTIPTTWSTACRNWSNSPPR